MLIVAELRHLRNNTCCDWKSFENAKNICTLLHRDNPELILFVYPHEELFRFVVENTSTFWPVSVQSARLEESVAFLEQEVVRDKLVTLGLRQLT